MDLFHGKDIAEVLDEAKRTLQQAQTTLASAQELIANLDKSRETADEILAKFRNLLAAVLK